MQTYDKFYRDQGVRLVQDFIHPIAWGPEAIFFPQATMIFWPNPTLTKEYPSRDHGVFLNAHKPFVYTILEYTVDAPAGNPRHHNATEAKFIKDGRKQAPDFRYLKIKSKLTTNVKNDIIFSLGCVNTAYRYVAHPLTAYHIWQNTLGTALELASIKRTGVSRHKFVVMTLPVTLPTRAQLEQHLGEFTRNTLKLFGDAEYFNLLELFNFVHKDHIKHSVINNQVNAEEFPYIDLVIQLGNKYVIVNLAVLASISDAHTAETGLKKYSSETVIKILYIFLHRIVEAIAKMSVIEADKHDVASGLVGVVTDASDAGVDSKTDNPDEKAIHDIISDELDESTGLEESKDVVLDDLDAGLNALEAEDTIEGSHTASESAFNEAVELTDNSPLETAIKDLATNKMLTKATSVSLLEAVAKQDKLQSPYKDGTRLKDALHVTEAEIELNKDDVTIPTTSSIPVEKYNVNTAGVVKAKYIKHTYKKDILSVIYAAQNSGLVIKDHEIDKTSTVLGEYEMHKFAVQTLDGSKSTIRIKLPVVKEDGTFKMSGHTYTLRTQRADIPLKKISNTVVSISSYYGKLFVSKATFKKNDAGYWFNKQLLAKYDTDEALKDIANSEVVSFDANVPSDYGLIGRYVKGFKYKSTVYSFEYETRASLIKGIDLNKVEKKGVLVGAKGKLPVVMDTNNTLWLMDGSKAVDLGTLYDILDIDRSKGPIEYASAKIYKTQVPVAVLLAYYVGFTQLLKFLKVKYTIIDTGKRAMLTKDQYRIIFKDKTYIVERDYGTNDLIVGGFAAIVKQTKTISQVLDTKSGFTALYSALGLPLLYSNEITLMGRMYVDPITTQVLKLFKLPTTFRGLLVKAVSLLQDDNYIDPNSMDGSILKGYERISGMVYLEMVNAIRLNTNKSHFSKSAITLSPYAVMNRISSDSTTALLTDINPIAALKQHEDVTFLGVGGRKEETMTGNSRAAHVTDIGVISESVKDSGSSGISAYLTAAPKLETTRGTVGKFEKSDSWASILSTSAMLAPFATKDDGKRLTFSL